MRVPTIMSITSFKSYYVRIPNASWRGGECIIYLVLPIKLVVSILRPSRSHLCPHKYI